jgi:hypothetical protein
MRLSTITNEMTLSPEQKAQRAMLQEEWAFDDTLIPREELLKNLEEKMKKLEERVLHKLDRR